MRKGMDNSPHGKLLNEMLPQLLIAMVKKAGGTYKIHVSDVDDTGQDLLAFCVDEDKNFIFEVQKKS